ncbi:MAG: DNA topoisomerase (ATP-hydrolyzing) subunit B [Bacilli bacterium]|jgi:DNA gyrase, B subunit|nr:DNA topoisomerase (ATP-hydrolyzing) subunit B [Staphylococcus sp.]
MNEKDLATIEAEKKYDSGSIQVLEGLEAVRKRPGMYIGSTGPRGLHHLVWEIVDNSVDEALAGFCNQINVEISVDNFGNNILTVVDNGRGMPTDIHPKTKVSATETIFTVLHAGGKFDNNSYKVSGGLHGVGASVVNALSQWLEVYVHRNGHIYRQRFEKGHPKTQLEIIGTTQETGTTVKFVPDKEIFKESITFDYETLRQRIQELAFLNKGLRLTIKDLRNPNNIKFGDYHYEGGLKEYVSFLNKGKKPLHSDIIVVEETIEDTLIEIAFQYTEDYSCNIKSFTNNITNTEGGTHEEGFRNSLTRILNNYGKNSNIFKKDESLSGDDVREGLTAIVSCKISDPQFEGQTKTKLGNTEVRRIVSQAMSDKFEAYLLENPANAKMIIEKSLLALRARLAAKKAREATRRKSPLDSLGFASKLSDCRTKDPQLAEMYIVEGDSAGGSAKMGRESYYQAILPLRGKVLNVEKAALSRALSNKEILSMIQAIGTGIGNEFQIENARYHKIVIMTDADVDGAHIRTLLLTFFYRFMRPIIEKGYVYIAQPPLYKIQQGKKIDYAYSDEELNFKLSEISGKRDIQRYKGLGEMNAEQLWETTMDPKKRILLQVTLNDGEKADEVFSMLMGEDVEPRRKFIEENAVFVQNLDV